MVDNDDAGYLNARVVPAFFASRLAPTETTQTLCASPLAMVGNDDAGCLNARVAPAFFASRLAPTETTQTLWERARSRWWVTMTWVV